MLVWLALGNAKVQWVLAVHVRGRSLYVTDNSLNMSISRYQGHEVHVAIAHRTSPITHLALVTPGPSDCAEVPERSTDMSVFRCGGVGRWPARHRRSNDNK
jgi:hypothetical protein